MKKTKFRGFTLVELLAVIVILAVILVIAIPQIINTIKSARMSSIKYSAILIATQADKNYLEKQVLDEDYNNTTIPCSDVANLNDDYESCSISYSNGIATVKLKGSSTGKFSGITCSGTKDNMSCSEKVIMACTGTFTPTTVLDAYVVTNKDICKPYIKNLLTDGINFEFSQDHAETYATNICNNSNNIYNNSQYKKSKYWFSDQISNGVFTEEDISDFAIKDTSGNVDGATYQDSLYTYTYFDKNIESEYLSVTLTNKTSTNPITQGPCSSVNEVPVMYATSLYLNSKAVSIDLRTADYSNVIGVDYMFNNSAATSINLSDVDFGRVTSARSMFYKSAATEIIGLNTLNFSKVTDASNMFQNSKATTLDLSNWDTTNLSMKTRMFNGASATTVYAKTSDDVTKLSTGTSMPNTMTISVKNS